MVEYNVAALADEGFIARTSCMASTTEKRVPVILFMGLILLTRKLDQNRHIHLKVGCEGLELHTYTWPHMDSINIDPQPELVN
jgi:hypothetical protein